MLALVADQKRFPEETFQYKYVFTSRKWERRKKTYTKLGELRKVFRIGAR